jgi:hypothetical protein
MWTKTCIYASEIFLDHIHFQYAQLLIWILTTDKFISIEKIKFSLLSISAITNELLKLIFNAYFFVENVYRICLVNILNFILKYDIWPPLIIISSLITSYWVGEKSYLHYTANEHDLQMVWESNYKNAYGLWTMLGTWSCQYIWI